MGERCGAKSQKVILELGGSDPALILEGAPLDHAVEQVVMGRTFNSGARMREHQARHRWSGRTVGFYARDVEREICGDQSRRSDGRVYGARAARQ
ncbi:aldehyde dehydrogenase family protein [Caballeronia sp. NK8]|uniref:aldehyde dehydrogenase family protein n=1 Tax=Caballeronia sp. NK8 TaxID=140098 RepID=UPI0026574EF1|nr:aldehyde dehydrogenase family protein [Caballeronia sp. NK8]